MDSNTQSQAQSLQEEIRKLKEQLNVLNADKEALFSKKEEVSRKIRALISEVVASKKERNALTDSVKVVKELRTKLNSEISTKLKAVGEIKKTAPAPGSYSMRGDSAEFIKAKIATLSTKIETEVMAFSKEQALNKEIKDLKKKLLAAQAKSDAYSAARGASSDIRTLKRQADAEHKKIQDVARASQEKHTKILEQSNVIDALKVDEQKFMTEFLAKKEEFTKMNDLLKTKISELKPLRDALGGEDKQRRDEGQRTVRKKLEDRRREAEEKLKTGKKLTTEDLIVLQGD